MRTRWTTSALLLVVIFISGCSKNPAKLTDHGKKYLEEGKYAEAILEFKNAIQADSHFASAYHLLAVAYLRQSYYRDALEAIQQAVQIDPNMKEAQILFGNLLILDRRFNEAETRALSVLKRDSNNYEAHLLLGNALARILPLNESLGELKNALDQDVRFLPAYWDMTDSYDSARDYAGAEESYNKAIGSSAESRFGHLALTSLYLQTDRLSEAERELKKAAALDPKSRDMNFALAHFFLQSKDNGSAEKIMLQMIQDHSGDWRFLLYLADFYYATGNADKAIAEYKKIVSKEVLNPLPRKRLANIYFVQNDMEKANQIAAEVLSLNPKDLEAKLIQGKVLLSQGKNQEAIAVLQETSKSSLASAATHYFLGVALARMKNFPKASQELENALKIDSSLVPAYLKLAEVQLELGDPTNAIRIARDSLKLNSRQIEAHLIVSEAFEMTHNYQSALAELQQCLVLSPGDARALRRLGAIYLARGEASKAEESFAAAIKSDPEMFEAYSGLAAVYVAQNKAAAAIQLLSNKAVEVRGKKQAFFYARLAAIYVLNQNFAQAAQSYEKAIQLDPDNGDYQVEMEKLKKKTGL